MDTWAPVNEAALPIPTDLFVSKKHSGLTNGELGFADSSGNIVYKADRSSSKKKSSSPCKRILSDGAGNTLFSMYRHDNGTWQVFKGADDAKKDLVFRVQRILNKLTRTELEVFLAGENLEESTSDFKVKGCVFQRSCTIYRGDSIVAQTSLMYKLHQIFVRRNKFRLTLFPESVDHALIVALIVIFLDS